MLDCGMISEYRDFLYQRVKKDHGTGEMIRAATEAVMEFKPELIVYISSWPKDDIPHQLLAGFEAAGSRVLPIAWDTFPGATDQTFRQNLWFQSCSYFCDVCSFSSYARFRFLNEQFNLNKGIIYLSGNNVLQKRFPHSPMKKNIDVSLLGSMYESRAELLSYLKEKLSGLGVTVSHFGGGFDESKAAAQSGAIGNWLPHDEYVDVINRSKIVLCPGGAEGQWAVRGKIFEFMSCGAFCLAEENFDINKTIPSEMLVTYSSFQNCLEKIKYYLEHEDERQNYAENSQAWYQKTYDHSDFWRDFLSGVKSGQNKFLNTPFVEANYQNSREFFLARLNGDIPSQEKILALELEGA